jgi:hypothetical protein
VLHKINNLCTEHHFFRTTLYHFKLNCSHVHPEQS